MYSLELLFSLDICPGMELLDHMIVLKSRDITWPREVHLVKAMDFPVIMCGCERWTVMELSAEELMLSECGAGEDS